MNDNIRRLSTASATAGLTAFTGAKIPLHVVPAGETHVVTMIATNVDTNAHIFLGDVGGAVDSLCVTIAARGTPQKLLDRVVLIGPTDIKGYMLSGHTSCYFGGIAEVYRYTS